jgi:hypothetical protein
VVRTRHHYALTGRLFHAQCGRRMQGSWNNQQAHYLCRFPSEYAIANKLDHPVTVYLREASLLPPLAALAAPLVLRLVPQEHRLENISSDSPALTPGAARAVLRMLLEARDKQTRKDLGAGAEQPE